MPTDPPAPPPPGIEQKEPKRKGEEAPIADMREKFARKVPQSVEDEARTRAFIDGKIEMIRHDPNMTDAEKAKAIADLQAKR